MKCTRAWTMAQEYLKVNVWGQCTLMEQQILGEKFIFKKLPESNFKTIPVITKEAQVNFRRKMIIKHLMYYFFTGW